MSSRKKSLHLMRHINEMDIRELVEAVKTLHSL